MIFAYNTIIHFTAVQSMQDISKMKREIESKSWNTLSNQKHSTGIQMTNFKTRKASLIVGYYYTKLVLDKNRYDQAKS